MSAVVIGSERANITLTRTTHNTELGYWSAAGSFCVGHLQGSFSTLVMSPERFVDELEVMNRELAGDAALHGMDDDVSVSLKTRSLGTIGVEARVNDNQSFDAKINFEIDQTYLTPLISAFKSSFLASP